MHSPARNVKKASPAVQCVWFGRHWRRGRFLPLLGNTGKETASRAGEVIENVGIVTRVRVYGKHSLSTWKVTQAPPSGFPLSSDYISPYIPPLVTIQIHYIICKIGRYVARVVGDFSWVPLVKLQEVCMLNIQQTLLTLHAGKCEKLFSKPLQNNCIITGRSEVA